MKESFQAEWYLLENCYSVYRNVAGSHKFHIKRIAFLFFIFFLIKTSLSYEYASIFKVLTEF